MVQRAGNVAFKVTWVYGSRGPFSSACTAKGREINVRTKTWCSQPQNQCCKVFRAGNGGGPVNVDDENYPCNDVMAFRWWSFSAGFFHKGKRNREPMTMLSVRPGKLAFFTSRPHDRPEAERLVIGCYRVGEVVESDDGGLWANSDPDAERFRVRDVQRAPRFWDFHSQEVGPRWNTGLFRYLSDSVAKRMFEAVRRASK